MPSHDQNLKNMIGDYLLPSLQFFVSDLASKWPKNVRVTPIRQEQFKRRLGDTFQELDIPIMVEFPDGSSEGLIIIIENESKKRPEFLEYLAIACIQISLMTKTRRVVPLVFYPFESNPPATEFTIEVDGEKFIEFRCRSCVLGKMKASDYENSRNLVARLCLPLMACDPEERLRMVTRAYEGLAEFEPNLDKRIKYSEFVGLYANLSKEEEHEFRDKYVEQSPFREELVSLTEIWKEQGKAEGEAIGKAEGVILAYRQMHASGILSDEQLRRQLNAFRRRGEIPSKMIDDAILKLFPKGVSSRRAKK